MHSDYTGKMFYKSLLHSQLSNSREKLLRDWIVWSSSKNVLYCITCLLYSSGKSLEQHVSTSLLARREGFDKKNNNNSGGFFTKGYGITKKVPCIGILTWLGNFWKNQLLVLVVLIAAFNSVSKVKVTSSMPYCVDSWILHCFWLPEDSHFAENLKT